MIMRIPSAHNLCKDPDDRDEFCGHQLDNNDDAAAMHDDEEGERQAARF